MRNPVAFETLITHLVHHIMSVTLSPTGSGVKKVDVIVGLDARGFLLGPIIALRLGEFDLCPPFPVPFSDSELKPPSACVQGASFVPVRKKGKLPGSCVTATYEKEYGTVSKWSRYRRTSSRISVN